MNYAEEIVKLLSKEEQRNFRIFATRTNAREDRKDLALLDAMRNQNYDEDRTALELYPDGDKNSFYRLKNRLVSDLGKSLLLLNAENGAFNEIVNLIILGRIFREKASFKLAASYFQKAEKLSLRSGIPELLDLVYGELIRLSHESLSIPPDEYIKKRKENRVSLNAIHEIDDVLAAVIYRLRNSQTFSSKNETVIKLLEKTIRSFSANAEVRSNPIFRTRIYQAVSRILLQRQDYKSLEEYLLKTYEEFLSDDIFNRTNHDTKLQMLVYLINSLFKNERHEESLRYTDLLKEALHEFDDMLYGKYVFYYYSGLVINYTVLDRRKAIDYLQRALDDPEIRKAPSNLQFIRLNLAVVSFDLSDFKSSLKHLVKIYRDSYFANLDASFRLKIHIAELLIRYELGDEDFILHQAGLLKKEFKGLLGEEDHERENLILEFMRSACKIDDSLELQRLAEEVYSGVSDSKSNDVINYSTWLKDKFLRKIKSKVPRKN